jgi:hypothetical protein
MRRLAVALVLLGACAGADKSGANRDVTLRTATGALRSFSLAKDGNLIGPTMSLAPTETGYRGMVDSAMVDLRSDGERISGTLRNQMVDLHVSSDDDEMIVRGLFAGRLGRITASSLAIYSTLGICVYDLEARGGRYEGQRACGGGRMPSVYPATVELPPGFERLSRDRQMMLLALLLTQ